jgi:YHS domain-containing protein
MRKTPLLRFVLVVFLVTLATACESTNNCDECEHGKRSATTAVASPTQAAMTVTKIQPWETANEAFNGCAGGCGMRVAGPQEGVIVQPGAMVGQYTYCPVSGVAFEIKAASAHRTIGDKTLYFCCESCAAYFMTNQASILAARGIAG